MSLRHVLPVCLTAVVCLASAAETSPANSKDRFTAKQRGYWAFQPVQHPAPPSAKGNPVDAFILEKLSGKQLGFSGRADKCTLLRRITFDLTGLPPTIAELEAFQSDASPDAYSKVVDRLLASPHYGEKWARHWLDLARYAESDGFKADDTRPNAWRYRDYVIKSFNENKPYDRFVKEQIAGDELWPTDPSAHVATGFLRHYPDEYNARNLFQRRQEILDEVTDTTAATFLGMTYGCARCHDHKFDPILQEDYYKLQAFFANTAADDDFPIGSPEQIHQYRQQRAQWEQSSKAVREQIAVLLAERRQAMYRDIFDKYPPEIQAMIVKPAASRTPYEEQMAHKAAPFLEFDDKTVAKALKGDERKRYDALAAELKAVPAPAELPAGIGVRDLGKVAPPTFILAGGGYDNKQREVKPGFLTIVNPNPAAPVPTDSSTGRRTSLANWLTDPANPLPSRVMVNRIWHYHFGQGLVGSPSDFGAMGQRPSHPELLDYLASEFVKSGWDMKAMHRLIVTSDAYQQSSEYSETAAKADPRNRLLWRFPRTRLEGEEIRDAALSISGLLSDKIGGPSVMPELPSGMPTPRGGWKTSPSPDERNRRSVYIFVRRNTRFPLLEVFDMPDTHESCGRRNVTLTAPQALTLLNNKTSIEWAQAFAGRVIATAGTDASKQIQTAYRLAYARVPDGTEKDSALTFLQKQRSVIGQRSEDLALPTILPAGADKAQAAAFVDFCHTLINSNEFVYRN